MDVRIGTSGWNYTEWRGSFYPKTMKPAGMLAYYSERFRTVEVNNTFYRMPTAKAVQGWAAGVPAGFRFVLKAPQRITHFKRLKDVDELVREFCDVARILGDKLGALLFQLPPNFKMDVGRLADLLVLLPGDLRAAFEFRNATWFTAEVYARLTGHNAALCIADNDDGATPAIATADWGYLRLRATGYTEHDLGDWLATIRRIGGQWRDAFVFFKHEDQGTGPAFGAKLASLVESA